MAAGSTNRRDGWPSVFHGGQYTAMASK